jgi:hypothetical protein
MSSSQSVDALAFRMNKPLEAGPLESGRRSGNFLGEVAQHASWEKKATVIH